MSPPLFSVIIPTRDRSTTLSCALATCLAQEFSDFEVLVYDVSCSQETEDMVRGHGSERIRYARPDQPVELGLPWEEAVALTTGRYLSLLADHNCLMPYAMREAALLLHGNPSAGALTWQPIQYSWPESGEGGSSYLAIPLERTSKLHSGRSKLIEAAHAQTGASGLPSLAMSFVSRAVIHELQERTGHIWLSRAPDDYLAFAIAFLSGDYVSITLPLSVSGRVTSAPSRGPSITPEEPPPGSRLSRHATVPDCDTASVRWHDAFQYAKDALFPEDGEVALELQVMLKTYAREIADLGPAEAVAFRESIKRFLKGTPYREAYFNQLIPATAATALGSIDKPAALGFDGNYLILDVAPFGSADAAEAAKLAAAILQVPPSGAAYDLPGAAALASELTQRTQQAEHLTTLLRERTDQAADLAIQLEQRTRQAEHLAALLQERTNQANELSGLLIDRTRRLEEALSAAPGAKVDLVEDALPSAP